MKLVICLSILSFYKASFALSVNEVVQSSLNYYPEVLISLEKINQQMGKVSEHEGSFDLHLKGELDKRLDGYYDGEYSKLSLVKPIPSLNTKVYIGIRKSSGEFPSYEGKNVTLSQGEQFMGLSISLIKDALIDLKRYKLLMSKQVARQSKVELEKQKIKVQTNAIKAYWLWYVAGGKLKVYQEILRLSLDRSSKIAKRVKRGDLAKLYTLENNQYNLKREVLVKQATQEFRQASLYLSLFYRDKKGHPQKVTEKDLPKNIVVAIPREYKKSGNDAKAVARSLDLKVLDVIEKQTTLETKIAHNEFLPSLDLSIETAQDRGNGLYQLEEKEDRILLSLNIPLQVRKGRGKLAYAKAKMKELQKKKQFTLEKIRVEVANLEQKLLTHAEVFNLTEKQIALSKKLAQMERKKFFMGGSDLLRVNLREEVVAEAQIKRLSAILKYKFVEAGMHEITVEFI